MLWVQPQLHNPAKGLIVYILPQSPGNLLYTKRGTSSKHSTLKAELLIKPTALTLRNEIVT